MPVLGIGAVVLLVGAIAFGPPVYKAFKWTRAEHAAAAAEDAMKQGDWEAAFRNVRLAVGLAPDNPAALRQAARISSLSGHPNAVQYWQLLMERTTPTRLDRLQFSQLLLRIHRSDLARVHLIELLRSNPHDAEAMELSLVLLLQEGRNPEALVAARALADEFPNRPGAELQLARTLLQLDAPSARSEAHHLLWTLVFRPGPDSFAALAEMSRLQKLSTNELRLLIRRIPDTQTNALLSTLVRANLQLRLNPGLNLAELGSQIRNLVLPGSPVEERLVATDWLLGKALPADALELSGPPYSRTNALVLQRGLQSLAQLGRWDAVAAQVEDLDLPMEPVMRDLYRAIVATRRNKPDEATTHLASAASSAESNPEQLLLIAGYAESLNQPRIAAEALQQLLGNPTLVPTTAPRILRLLHRVDDIPPMLQALDRLLQFDPGNDNLRNEQAWLRLLGGERLAESVEAAQALVEQHSDEPRYAATLALGLLRQEDPEKAYETLETRHLGEATAPIRARLVHCAALGASGRRDAARRAARGIDTHGLRSEERLLIQEWIEKNPAP